MDDKTTLGPLYSRQALDTVLKQIKSAVAGGAKVLLGGTRLERSGYFLVPTLLGHVEPGNPVFPPGVLRAGRHNFPREGRAGGAVALADDSPYGLGGTVISKDVARATTCAPIETGMVFINSAPQSAPELPFGGVKKNSGFGRELSDLGIAEFVNRKLVRIA